MNNDKFKRVLEIIQNRKQVGGITNSSGYKGVVTDNRHHIKKKYRATFVMVSNNSKINISLGQYNTPEEAYIARTMFIDSLK